jgi:hypothetical protein
MIAEASPRFVAALHATGLADELGEENIFPATDVVFEALDRALAEARRRRAESGRPDADT